jgi:hypothetical protein
LAHYLVSLCNNLMNIKLCNIVEHWMTLHNLAGNRKNRLHLWIIRNAEMQKLWEYRRIRNLGLAVNYHLPIWRFYTCKNKLLYDASMFVRVLASRLVEGLFSTMRGHGALRGGYLIVFLNLHYKCFKWKLSIYTFKHVITT